MRLCRFFFILLLVFQPLFAAEPTIKPIFLDDLDEEEQTPKIIPRQTPNPAKNNLQAVLKNLNADEIVQLNSKDNTKFTGVFKQALAKEAKGSFLILPGDGLYPTRLKHLIEQMTSVGWDTLSLSLPYYPRLDIIAQREIPAVEILSSMPKVDKDAEAKKEASEQDENAMALEDPQGKAADLDPPPTSIANSNLFGDEDEEQAPINLLPQKLPVEQVQQIYAQKIQNRFASARAWLENKRANDWITLVLHRENAYWLSSSLSNNILPKSIPLVFLNTVAPKAYDENSLSKSIIALGRRPILDIYNPNNAQEAKLAKLRFAAYKRAGNDLAIQVKEYSKATDSEKYVKDWIAQRISGWVRSLENQHPKIKYGILNN